MAEQKVELKEVYPVPEKVQKMAYINSMDNYKAIYKRSIEDPDGFWGETGLPRSLFMIAFPAPPIPFPNGISWSSRQVP